MSPHLRIPVGSGRHIGLGVTPALRVAAEAAQPGSILVAGTLHGATWRHVVLTVEDGPGTVQAGVVLERLGSSRWQALPLIVDEAGAPLLARLIHLSPARRVMGIGPHVAPLVAHLPRRRSIGRSDFNAVADAVPMTQLDPRSRAATSADLAVLVDLFADGYSLGRQRDRAAWTRVLRRAVPDGLAVVADIDGEIVGAMTCSATTDTWTFGSDLVVREDHRGQGLSWAMTNRLFALATVYGLKTSGAQIDENPMSAENHYGTDFGGNAGQLWGVGLDPHLRVRAVRWAGRQVRRGQRRLSGATGGRGSGGRDLAAEQGLDRVGGLDGGRLVGQGGGVLGVVVHPADTTRGRR